MDQNYFEKLVKSNPKGLIQAIQFKKKTKPFNSDTDQKYVNFSISWRLQKKLTKKNH